jgi:hypothetical protein
MKGVKKYPFDKEKTTVHTAEEWVMAEALDGVECPCCGQLAKVYRRKLYCSMAYALLLIYRTQKQDFLHVPNLLNGHGSVARGGDFAKLTYWDLLEPHEKKPGYYRLTEKGRQFAECRIAVPVAVHVYDGDRIGWDTTEMVTVADALSKKFNYEELMEGT